MMPTGCFPARTAPAGVRDYTGLLTARRYRGYFVRWLALVLLVALSLQALPAAGQATIIVNTTAEQYGQGVVVQ